MIRLALVSAAALALSGCGNVCDRYANYNASLEKKVEGCSQLASFFPKTTFSVSTCNENLSACSSEDVRKINESMDCFDKVSACTEATMEAWAKEIETCGNKTETVTTACSDALSKAVTVQ